MPNLHSKHCHSVRRAQNRLNRLKARGARPRYIARAERALESRKATAEVRAERRADAVKDVTEILQNEIEKHFPSQNLHLPQEKS